MSKLNRPAGTNAPKGMTNWRMVTADDASPIRTRRNSAPALTDRASVPSADWAVRRPLISAAAASPMARLEVRLWADMSWPRNDDDDLTDDSDTGRVVLAQ